LIVFLCISFLLPPPFPFSSDSITYYIDIESTAEGTWTFRTSRIAEGQQEYSSSSTKDFSFRTFLMDAIVLSLFLLVAFSAG
jgi:hypothetical protein